ncbi:siderophore-interacting protein [Micromonospora sp. NPDC050417]|uniref:siderophore-interacting protein n=1 Tax=Micromonospora sp. NPDC050417 TaxID=3364280 RepID=UPI0037A629C2
MTEIPPAPPRRRRSPPKPASIVAVHPLTTRMVCVELGGPGLTGFESLVPAQHVKIFLPQPGQTAPSPVTWTPTGPRVPEGQPWPIVRTYTPRRWNSRHEVLEIEMLIHPGLGPAAQWAQRAAVGDAVAIGSPGGGYRLPADASSLILAVDETALPAAATILENLPTGLAVQVLAEVGAADDEVPLPVTPLTTVRWLARGDRPAGDVLTTAVRGLAVDERTAAFVAGEATAVRSIRKHLLDEAGLIRDRVVTRGYWKQGTVDHPDHDYGEEDVATRP